MIKKYNSISAKLLAKKYKLRLKNIPSKNNKVTIKDVKNSKSNDSKSKTSKSKKSKVKHFTSRSLIIIIKNKKN